MTWVVVAGCLPSRTDQLLSLLPTSVGGHRLDQSTVINDSFRPGHSIDDVLSAIGKSRSDAAAVFRGDRDGSITVGAVTVNGVDAETLLEAVVNNWDAAAVVDRSLANIGGKMAWLLTMRPSDQVAAYAKLGVVYLVLSADAGILDDAVRAMP